MNKKTIILTLLFLASLSAKAQNDIQETKPKVGLVLSGGGAKGMAHIGALKVIDSLGVKIDYVAGTSMGAIVGALYASGYSGNQLDSIFKEVDFDKIISDNLPRASKAFVERNNSEKYVISLPFDDFKLKLPSALSKGQNTYALFSKLALHVSDVEDFSKLPIPFFCIATNVETGEPVMLDKGNLTQSILASGAFPSLFQPVVIHDQTLIDGGVANNYPVDELRAKGMDVIIGVDVQDGLMGKKDLKSAPSVLLQINNFRTIEGMKVKAGKTDVYIKPDVKDYTVVSFDDRNQIIEAGKTASLEKIEHLKTLIDKDSKTLELNIKHPDSITINNIKIKGLKKYTRAYVLGKLKFKNYEKISYKDYTKGINSLVATNDFDAFEYELKSSKNEEGYDFIANLTEAETSTFLKLGLHYDNLYKSAALLNVTKKHLLIDNDVVSLDLILGDNPRYNFEYLIDKGFYWSVGVTSRFNEFHKNISPQLLLEDSEITSTGLNKIDAELQDQTNQFYLQTLFRKDFALRLGGEHKRIEIKSETLLTDIQDEDYVFEKTDYISVFADLKLDTYDDKYFPKKGIYFNSDMHYYFYASHFNDDFENFAIAKAEIGYAVSTIDKLAFNFKASGGFKLGDNGTNTLDFALGGYGNDFINNFIPFLGYDSISLTGNSFIKAYAAADYEVIKNHHITLEGNWANIDRDIFNSGEWFSLPDYRGYALGYGVNTFLGPIQAKFSYSPERKKSIWFFNLGFWF